MTADGWAPHAASSAARRDLVASSRLGLLRHLVIGAGVCASILFVLVGLLYRLQEYGDGSIFSYAVAVQDAWAFHWHNISGRLLVYLVSFVPAETYVGLTGDARGGISLYGFLFFSAQALGLATTFAADRSSGRVIFCYACASTLCLCPLVFGAPTEMWMAHALFWPALALCHYRREGVWATALMMTLLLALVLTHEGAVVFAFAILATTLLRGWRDPTVLRVGGGVIVAMVVWTLVKLRLPPDAYFASILPWAELNFISYRNFDNDLVRLLGAALAGYGILFLAAQRIVPKSADVIAGAIVAGALAVFWLRFDHSLHTDDRYYMRTALLFATPVAGALAAAAALRAEHRLRLPIPGLSRLMDALASETAVRATFGVIVLVLLVHTVETAKFVMAWTHYKAAVRALATGTAADPALGDSHFVSSARIEQPALQRLSWPSTTPFLSVLMAPGFAPLRLVVDPQQDYFWISCTTAKANEQAARAIPVESRRLIRVHTCLHR
jgi:hypothetical protein